MRIRKVQTTITILAGVTFITLLRGFLVSQIQIHLEQERSLKADQKYVKHIQTLMANVRKETEERRSLKADHKDVKHIQTFMANVRKETEEDRRDKNTQEQNIKILCLVMTIKLNMHTKARAVNGTWGSRCTKLLFISAEKADLKNVVQFDIIESREHLTMKTVQTLEFAYDQYLNDYDWFLKADDDVYFIMENLRYLLSHHDSTTPVYLGHQFRLFTKQGYMSGGSGYIISKEALRVLNEKGLKKPGMCKHDGSDEDLDIGKCFDKIGVKPYSSVDKFGRQSFHPYGLHKAISGDFKGGEHLYVARPYHPGKECCSQLSISFHYVNPVQMYLIEMMLYNFNVYGRSPSIVDRSFFTAKESIISDKNPDEILTL